MAISDQQSLQKFPFSFDLVWEHILKVLQQEGFDLEEKDKLIGRIIATSGMSVVSWGENLSISLDKIDETTTSVNILCGLKVGFNLAANYKNQKNIDKLFMALSKSLQNKYMPYNCDSTELSALNKVNPSIPINDEEIASISKGNEIAIALAIIAVIGFFIFVNK